ncbi:AraC family transcriptional regulator [Parasediminibacterium sp. JCM 36343]|uniref:AraC family transcriptional regulator n=1 Tax=Parasediminibacterium sp. JCM 36343 TaxID=3374279 RepID=UPI00397CD797
MKPKLLKISVAPQHSFSCRFDSVPFFYSEWHFHPEIELVYIQKGTGTQFIGNSVNHFSPGDMVLVGSNLPHLWKCDPMYFAKGSVLKAESLVVHFMPDLMGAFMQLPENKLIVDLLERAKQGLQIVSNTKETVLGYMQSLQTATGAERLILLLQILQTLATSQTLEPIAANNMQQPSSEKENERMGTIFKYMLENFSKPITLDDIARLANISPNAFCRFFKARTKKTFSRFLLEMRINHACKLLAESEKSIEHIYTDCGFNNSSHFNRYFKQLNGTTPLEYRKKQLLRAVD